MENSKWKYFCDSHKDRFANRFKKRKFIQIIQKLEFGGFRIQRIRICPNFFIMAHLPGFFLPFCQIPVSQYNVNGWWFHPFLAIINNSPPFPACLKIDFAFPCPLYWSFVHFLWSSINWIYGCCLLQEKRQM